jgi:hypothetical protein
MLADEPSTSTLTEGDLHFSFRLRLVLLLKAEIDIVEFVFEHLVFMIESLTDFIQFFVLFPILVDFLLLREALLSQLSDLDFVVGKIEELSLVLL